MKDGSLTKHSCLVGFCWTTNNGDWQMGFQPSKHVEKLAALALNDRVDPGIRSRAAHDLMNIAMIEKDRGLWEHIGKLLIKMFQRNDMAAQVSDHFVDNAPQEVFIKFAFEGPGSRFNGWRNRANKLGDRPRR
jgi:hypothetical protein